MLNVKREPNTSQQRRHTALNNLSRHIHFETREHPRSIITRRIRRQAIISLSFCCSPSLSLSLSLSHAARLVFHTLSRDTCGARAVFFVFYKRPPDAPHNCCERMRCHSLRVPHIQSSNFPEQFVEPRSRAQFANCALSRFREQSRLQAPNILLFSKFSKLSDKCRCPDLPKPGSSGTYSVLCQARAHTLANPFRKSRKS